MNSLLKVPWSWNFLFLASGIFAGFALAGRTGDFLSEEFADNTDRVAKLEDSLKNDASRRIGFCIVTNDKTYSIYKLPPHLTLNCSVIEKPSPSKVATP